MATHTTNKILLEFEVSPDRTLAALATIVVPILEEAFLTGTNFKPVCPQLVSEMVSKTFLFIVIFMELTQKKVHCHFHRFPHKSGQI